MILTILFIMTMFLWFLTLLPVQQVEAFSNGRTYLGFIAVLLLGIYLFVPALR